MAIDYTKRKPVDYTHPTRPRRFPKPDSDGIIRLRKGESIVLR